MAWLLRNFVKSQVGIHATPQPDLLRDRFDHGWNNARHRFSPRFVAMLKIKLHVFVAHFTLALLNVKYIIWVKCRMLIIDRKGKERKISPAVYSNFELIISDPLVLGISAITTFRAILFKNNNWGLLFRWVGSFWYQTSQLQKLLLVLTPGGEGHLGIFWVSKCRPGLQIGTPF